MRQQHQVWTAVVVAALVLEGWALYVVSFPATRWCAALIVRDEPVGRALYDAMTDALRQAERLSCTSFCSGPDARISIYSVRQAKPDRFRLNVVNGMSSKDTTLLSDGNDIWAFWSGDRPYMAVDDDASHDAAAAEVYLRKPAPAGASDAGRQIALLGRAWYPLILDPDIFHGHADSFEPYIDGIRSRGRNDVGDEVCDVIEVSYMQAQRTRFFWIARADHLPRRIKEVIRRADVHVTIEEWNNLAVDEDIPPKTFAWSPPESWQAWTPPSAERFLLAAGREAPDFELRAAGRGTVRLSDYRGQVVWLCVWQVGSPACHEQMRLLQALHEQYSDQGLAILGLNCFDNRRIARAFLRSHDVTFPNVLDASEIAQRLVKIDYGNRTLDVPANFIIGRAGKVVDAWYGGPSTQPRGLTALERAGRPVESHPAR